MDRALTSPGWATSAEGVALIAIRCRTSDRTAAGGRGVEVLAQLLGKRLGREPRMIGTAAEPREAGWDEDLRDSRGCLLEAGGQVEDALTGGRLPVLLASDCSICLTTLPAVLRHRPDARILWLDAHGDYNTPDTSPSGFLGGMCLAGACGEWDPEIGQRIPASRVVLAGVRDLDPRERELLERSEAVVIGASSVETLVAAKNAVGRCPVYVHLDLDVLDPAFVPAAFPAPGGLHPDKLYDLLEAITGDSDLVGVEVTGFEAPSEEVESQSAASAALQAMEPLLEAIPSGAHVKG